MYALTCFSAVNAVKGMFGGAAAAAGTVTASTAAVTTPAGTITVGPSTSGGGGEGSGAEPVPSTSGAETGEQSQL